jgi:hypothetical protein
VLEDLLDELLDAAVVLFYLLKPRVRDPGEAWYLLWR